MDPELSFIMANEKSPDYSSAKKCDKMRQLENAWGAATGRSNAKNAVKSCVSQRFGAQKSIKVSFLIRGTGIRVHSDNQAPGGGFERQHGLRNKVIDHLTEIFSIENHGDKVDFCYKSIKTLRKKFFCGKIIKKMLRNCGGRICAVCTGSINALQVQPTVP